MSPRTAIPLPLDQLTDFCRRHGIVRLEAFGSILRDDFGTKSDVDLMYTLAPGVIDDLSFEDLDDWARELRKMLHRKVDLLDRVAVEESHNPYRRTRILRSAEVLVDLEKAA